jgi:hypothetical protein
MADERPPQHVISDMIAERAGRTNAAILAELKALPPLADETNRCWEDATYWQTAAYPYIALSGVAAERRLRPAIRLLLDRACYGDPGEIMRGLRHALEAIVNPDWKTLATICLKAARSDRLGTRLWAIDQLSILDDPRAQPIFEEAVRDGPEEIRWRAQIGLDRLQK